MRELYTNTLKICFSISLLLYILLFASCRQEANTIYSNSFGNADYEYLKQELSKSGIPSIEENSLSLKYKFIYKEGKKKKKEYHLYAGKIKESFMPQVIDSLKKYKILINKPLSENIMFSLKLGDAKNFELKMLKPKIKRKKIFEANLLDDNEGWINRMNGYYFYRGFMTYNNPEKTRRKHKEAKLLLLDKTTNFLVFYSEYIDY